MATRDPRTHITFAKRQSTGAISRTCWLEIEAPVGAEPVGLFADLRAAGWAEAHAALPAHQAYDARTFKPLGYSVVERTFTKRGSGTFTTWTEAEAKTNMTQARGILRKHGFERVPVWHKTIQDML